MVFQSTHPSGVRQHVGVRLHGHLRISIHAPQWGATRATRNSRQSLLISIHAPQWGATDGDQLCLLAPWYFNPRTPVGCDDCLVDGCVADLSISIHAPQWGATPAISAKCAETQFQSTHPSGVRLHKTVSKHSPVIISIHAPQWGATAATGAIGQARSDFNPRTPVGCDEYAAQQTNWANEFQSTHPSGVRPDRWPTRVCPRYFNPRTPVGCDGTRHVVERWVRISIHAPQWGATRL